MTAISPEWLQNAVANGLVEWCAEYAANGLSEPTEREQQIFKLGFTYGVDAGIAQIAEALTREDDAS